MDIRNFFSSKKDNTDSKKNVNNNKNSSKTTTPTKDVKGHKNNENTKQRASTSSSRDSKAKKSLVVDSSSTIQDTRTSKKRLVILDDDDESNDNGAVIVDVVENKERAFTTQVNDRNEATKSSDRMEVDPQKYFSSSSNVAIDFNKKNKENATSTKDIRKQVRSFFESAEDEPTVTESNNDVSMKMEEGKNDDDYSNDVVVIDDTSPRRSMRSPLKTKNPTDDPRVDYISKDKQGDNRKDGGSHSKMVVVSSVTKNTKQQASSFLKPNVDATTFDMDNALPEILNNCTFVFTGVLPNLSRDDAVEMVKILGGRVTTAVSSKTNYLVFGDVLEDGRNYIEGSKYKKAIQLGTTMLVHGECSFYGLLKQYNDRAAAAAEAKSGQTQQQQQPKVPTSEMGGTNNNHHIKVKSPPSSNSVVAASNNSTTVKTTNPYAKSVNPYARTNPYAAASTKKNPYNRSKSVDNAEVINNNTVATVKDDSTSHATSTNMNQLWVDKYKPHSSGDILGNQDAVKKLAAWLATWEDRFNHPQSIGKSFAAPNGPWKAALLSGPPGIGKTTTATLVAKESGRDVLEFNASDVRSKKAMQEELGDITGSHTLEFTFQKKKQQRNNGNKTTTERKKRCIIMDEVDGMGAGDRSGVSELIQMIKHSRVPIICICNDRQSQKLKSLIPYCMDLKYRRPVKTVIVNRVVDVAHREGLIVERNAAEAIVESCGNDVRQVLNCLQMWASNRNTSTMTYKNLKDREHSINKDEILRVGIFDAARVIVEGRKGLQVGADMQTQRNHLFQRTDAFFVDYSIVGLMVHQNYIKVIQPQFNDVHRNNDQMGKTNVLNRMSDAASCMSDFAMVEHSLRDGQNWNLLPFMASLTVQTGYYAGGERGGTLPAFPEWTAWMGRNSSRGKKIRILKELEHHLNYHITGSTQEVRLSYIPMFRDRFIQLLVASSSNVQAAVDLMDQYGLDRDDVFEKLDEFKINNSNNSMDFTKMDSKSKGAFTRLYNQGCHKSQALVAEQGVTKKGNNKRGNNGSSEGGGGMEPMDMDAIDDDRVGDVNNNEDNDDDDEEELDAEKIKAMFKKKGRSAATTSAAKKAPVSRKRK